MAAPRDGQKQVDFTIIFHKRNIKENAVFRILVVVVAAYMLLN